MPQRTTSFLLIAGLLAGFGASSGLVAQDVPPAVPSADGGAQSEAVADTTARRQVSPMGAFLRSLALPGWGQAKLDRKLTGGVFIAWEGVTLAMSIKANHELGYLRRINSSRVEAKKQEREDWLILLAFNHLFAGLEAYVSAHLWDFPGDIKIRALPDGSVSAGFSIPLR
ncbi:MAG TPA: hypothetical protein VK845_01630 [Gemmatimonadales bacterium]|nr:hypothetical protein [Gemmatimonadales bacterium]